MKSSINGRQAILNYLARTWDLDQIYAWALEFGDDPEQREDKWSMGVAGEILERMRELGDGIRSADEFDDALKAILTPVTATQ
jgi:HD-like signal output (HDOD) protein